MNKERKAEALKFARNNISVKDCRELAVSLIDRLIDLEEIGYFDGTDEDIPEASLYWRSCGEDVLGAKE